MANKLWLVTGNRRCSSRGCRPTSGILQRLRNGGRRQDGPRLPAVVYHGHNRIPPLVGARRVAQSAGRSQRRTARLHGGTRHHAGDPEKPHIQAPPAVRLAHADADVAAGDGRVRGDFALRRCALTLQLGSSGGHPRREHRQVATHRVQASSHAAARLSHGIREGSLSKADTSALHLISSTVSATSTGSNTDYHSRTNGRQSG